jgi:hypothetical protein
VSDTSGSGKVGQDTAASSGRKSKAQLLWAGIGGAAVVAGLVSSLWAIGGHAANVVRDLGSSAASRGHSGSGCGAGPGEPGPIGDAGWGPKRTVFTISNPAPYATLDAIKNNPNYGDELTFFDAKPVDVTNAGGFCDLNNVRDGQYLIVRAYLENSASDNLGNRADANAIRIRMWAEPQDSSLETVWCSLTSSNTQPRQIWDSTQFAASHPFRMDPIDGSGRVYSNIYPKGQRLADSAWGPTGARVPLVDKDGGYPPGYEYAALVVFTVRISYITG